MNADLLWYIGAVAIVTAVIMSLFYVANVVMTIIFGGWSEKESNNQQGSAEKSSRKTSNRTRRSPAKKQANKR